MFAKIFEDDIGQILVMLEKQNDYDDGACVILKAEYAGVTEYAVIQLAEGSDVDAFFNAIDYSTAASMAQPVRVLLGFKPYGSASHATHL